MSLPAVRPRLLAIGGLAAMASAVGIGRFIYTPILPAMAEGLGLTKGEAGLIASANFVGYLAGAVAAAAPGIGRPRAWLLGMLAVSTLTTGAMGLSQGMDVFLALRFLGGAASAYVLVLASALVLERLAATGNAAYSSIHFSGVGTGIALSAVLTWAVTRCGLGWQAMWIAGGLASLAGLAVVALLVPDAGPGQPKPQAVAAARGDPRLRLLALAYGLFGFGYVITATFIVVIVRSSPAAIAIEPVFWLVFGLSAIPSVALWVGAGRRMRIVRAFAVACLVEAAGVFASVAWPGVAGLLLASALLGGTFMGITALGLMAARDLAPASARRWVGILTAAFGLGQIAGPLVAGYGYDLTGSFFLPSMLAVAALFVSGALALVIDRRRAA